MPRGNHEAGLEGLAADREWLLTDGLGGFASSTVAGPSTRRYHGWLTPRVAGHGGRFVVLAGVEEGVGLGNRSHKLGGACLHAFSQDPLPTFTYCLDGVFLERTLIMPRGDGRLLVVYRFLGPLAAGVALLVRPLVTFRFYHHLLRANDWPFRTASGPGWVTVQPHADAPVLVLRHAPTGGEWHGEGSWRRGVEYAEERRRGLDYVEDLYCPGWLEWQDRGQDDRVVLTAGLAENEEELARLRETPFDVPEALRWQDREARRRRGVVRSGERAVRMRLPRAVNRGGGTAGFCDAGETAGALADHRSPAAKAFLADLLEAAEAFITIRGGVPVGAGLGRTVRGAGPETTVIAGYPWFEDWGRDTLIAFPGLFLVPGRFEEGFQLLTDYASFIRDGLIPNRFPDQASDPEYVAADAALWFIRAVQAYLAYTGDRARVIDVLLSPVRAIAGGYAAGTRLGLRTEPDGLVHAGAPDTAVTWMDARLGDWVVTPRRGHPVELSALWYNALCFLGELERESPSGGGQAGPWTGLAARVRRAFNARFWNVERGCLYDVIGETSRDGGDGGGGQAGSASLPDAALRPNQILAVALPYPVLDPPRWRPVVQACLGNLYTAYGLRTLAPSDSGYRGLYSGGPAERDAAYHQGTVWPWLLGPFITALRRVDGRSAASRRLAARMMAPLAGHLREAGVGYISEVFDGDFPHLPGGCIAQAWSVAEVLRAYVEDVLDARPAAMGRG